MKPGAQLLEIHIAEHYILEHTEDKGFKWELCDESNLFFKSRKTTEITANVKIESHSDLLKYT